MGPGARAREPGRRRLRQVGALARLQSRLVLNDWQPVGVLILMPLLLLFFIRPAYRAELRAEGYAGTNGTEQAVPGLAVLFSFLLAYMGFEFFREHGLHTWDRLRASALRPADLIAGKSLPFVALALAQYAVLFGAGAVLFGLTVRGSLVALAVICLLLVICVLALGVMLIALSRSYQQLNSSATLGAFVLAGVGGAISPLPTLPAWVQDVGHASPTYWAMRAFRAVILQGQGVGSVLGSLAALAAFSVVFLVVAAYRFRLDEEKLF